MKKFCKRGHLRMPENLYKNGNCKVCNDLLSEEWRKTHPKFSREKNRRQRESCKLDVLAHYGKRGKLCCCWKSCKVNDVDMLTLDHIKDDGQRHRNSSGTRRLSSDALYRWTRSNGFPKLFQTLCSNHQMKKRLLQDRKTRL